MHEDSELPKGGEGHTYFLVFSLMWTETGVTLSACWANDPAHIASRIREYRRLMDHWQNVVPVPVHHVDYEETVADLEAVARCLLGAAGRGHRGRQHTRATGILVKILHETRRRIGVEVIQQGPLPDVNLVAF